MWTFLETKPEIIVRQYHEYRSGLSLQQVAKKFGTSRHCVYLNFKHRGYKLRANPKRKATPTKIVDGIKFSQSGKGGYWRATNPKLKQISLNSYLKKCLL